ncbi:hypothetical protein Tco_1493976 [Tanacetum coccineum]
MKSLNSNSQERELHQLQQMQDNAKESCMTSFQLLHSFLQLDKDEFQEDKYMAAFWVLNNQFQKFIDWQYFLDYDSEMLEKLFAEYTGIKVKQFRETLLIHIDIRPVNDQVPSAEVHLTAEHNVLANEQQHTDQSEPIYDTYLLEKVDSNTIHDSTNMSHRGGEIDQDVKQDQNCYNDKVFSSQVSLSMRNQRTPRSCLRWIPTGRIFKLVGLRWIPTGKMFIDSTTKVDGEPSNGSNEDITNPYKCDQTLNVSAGTLNLSTCTSFNPNKERLRVWLPKRLISHKPGLQGIQI